MKTAHFFFLLLAFVGLGGQNESNYTYGLVVDAGSSHSGIEIFKWKKRESPSGQVPESFPVEGGKPFEVKPGLGKDNDTVAWALEPLIAYAKEELKEYEEQWGEIPIYLGATAGFRVLPDDRRKTLLGSVREYFGDKDKCPFLFDPDYAVILSGEEEALYGWLTVNYWLDTLTDTRKGVTVGALDLGGKSTQITWEVDPSYDILEDYTRVELFGTVRRLYTHSFLQYGSDAALSRLLENIHSASGKYESPCFNTGGEYVDDDGNAWTGTSNSEECRTAINQLFFKDTPCKLTSCSINGVYQPTIDTDITYYGFSGMGHLTALGLPKDRNIMLEDLEGKAIEVCGYSWQQLNEKFPGIWGPETRCFSAMYSAALLNTGYEYPTDVANLRLGTEVCDRSGENCNALGWSTGLMLFQANQLPFEIISPENIASQLRLWQTLGIVAFSLLGIACVGVGIIAIVRRKKQSPLKQKLLDGPENQSYGQEDRKQAKPSEQI